MRRNLSKINLTLNTAYDNIELSIQYSYVCLMLLKFSVVLQNPRNRQIGQSISKFTVFLIYFQLLEASAEQSADRKVNVYQGLNPRDQTFKLFVVGVNKHTKNTCCFYELIQSFYLFLSWR